MLEGNKARKGEGDGKCGKRSSLEVSLRHTPATPLSRSLYAAQTSSPTSLFTFMCADAFSGISFLVLDSVQFELPTTQLRTHGAFR